MTAHKPAAQVVRDAAAGRPPRVGIVLGSGLADIAGFYKAWGIDIASDAHDRLDHISAECEFMSFLLLKLDYFSSKDEKEDEEICIDSAKKFLEEHLGKWVPIFSALVMKKSPGGLYHKAVKLLKEFIEKEVSIMSLEVTP